MTHYSQAHSHCSKLLIHSSASPFLSPSQPVGFVSFDSRSEAEAAKNALNVSGAERSRADGAHLLPHSRAFSPTQRRLHFDHSPCRRFVVEITLCVQSSAALKRASDQESGKNTPSKTWFSAETRSNVQHSVLTGLLG